MTFDSRAFRYALGCFPTGVVVVTAGAGQGHNGDYRQFLHLGIARSAV